MIPLPFEATDHEASLALADWLEEAGDAFAAAEIRLRDRYPLEGTYCRRNVPTPPGGWVRYQKCCRSFSGSRIQPICVSSGKYFADGNKFSSSAANASSGFSKSGVRSGRRSRSLIQHY